MPDRLIVSDMPLRGGGALPTPQMSEAIAYVLRQRGFRAGRLRIGYQSCDDSTAQAGIFDEDKCAANAKLFAATPAVIGEIGPFNSGCAYGQIPIANRAGLAMISPTNSDVAPDARDAPRARRDTSSPCIRPGERNYVRDLPARGRAGRGRGPVRRDAGAAPGGRAQRRRLRRGVRPPLLARRAQDRARRGVERRWNPKAGSYDRLADRGGAGRPRRCLRQPDCSTPTAGA